MLDKHHRSTKSPDISGKVLGVIDWPIAALQVQGDPAKVSHKIASCKAPSGHAPMVLSSVRFVEVGH